MAGAVVIGAGPGLGAAIARRFARAGFPITLIARNRDAAEGIAARLREHGVPVLPLEADVTDEDALRSAIDRSVDEFGVPDVVVYNAALIRRDAPGEMTAQQHLDAYAVNVVGALTAAAYAIPAMASRGGSFIITSGMPEPVAAVHQPVAREGGGAGAGRDPGPAIRAAGSARRDGDRVREHRFGLELRPG